MCAFLMNLLLVKDNKQSANQLATRAIHYGRQKRKVPTKSKAKYSRGHRTKDTRYETSHKEQSVHLCLKVNVIKAIC